MSTVAVVCFRKFFKKSKSYRNFDVDFGFSDMMFVVICILKVNLD